MGSCSVTVWMCAHMQQEMEKLIRPEVLIKVRPWDRRERERESWRRDEG